MKTKLIIALALLSLSILFAQTGVTYIEQAMGFLEGGYCSEAEVIMNKAIAQSPKNYENYLVMFKVQLAKGDMQKAHQNLDYYVNNASGIDYDHYQNLLFLIEDSAIRKAKGLAQYQIGFLPAYLNSEYPDFAPVVSSDGSELYFTSARDSKTLKENIFVSKRIGGTWGKPMPIKTLNSDYNVSLNSFSNDGEWAYLFGNYNNEKGKNDIYRAKRVQTAFAKPEKIAALSSKYRDVQPYAFEDRVMFFTSDRPGSLGGFDIWVSEYNNGWQEPVNLGTKINTIHDEQSPFLHWDGQTLFFASNGHPSFGGFDIFKAKKNGMSWTDWETPVNLGPEINTIYNERHYYGINNSNEFFISSDRRIGKGGEDIFKVVILNEEYIDGVRVYGEVVDNYGKPVSAEINWKYTFDNKEITKVAQSNHKGYYNIYLPKLDNVSLMIAKPNYQTYSGTLNFDEDASELVHDIQITLLEEKNYVIENIYFDFDKATLQETSFESLDNLASTILNAQNINVCIVGHTDNIGSAKYNKNLSEQRAKTVYQYLMDKNINAGILQYRGEGQDIPKVPNDTEENRQLNRRVEFAVMKTDAPATTVIETPKATEAPKATETPKVTEPIVEELVETMEVDDSIFLDEESVREIVQESKNSNNPFLKEAEINIINNRILKIANDYQLESKMQIHLFNNDNRISVTAVNFANGKKNTDFVKEVKNLLNGWFIPGVELTNYVIEIDPSQQ